MLNINKIVENPRGDGHKAAPEKEKRQKMKSRNLCSGPFCSALYSLYLGEKYIKRSKMFFFSTVKK